MRPRLPFLNVDPWDSVSRSPARKLTPPVRADESASAVLPWRARAILEQQLNPRRVQFNARCGQAIALASAAARVDRNRLPGRLGAGRADRGGVSRYHGADTFSPGTVFSRGLGHPPQGCTGSLLARTHRVTPRTPTRLRQVVARLHPHPVIGRAPARCTPAPAPNSLTHRPCRSAGGTGFHARSAKRRAVSVTLQPMSSMLSRISSPKCMEGVGFYIRSLETH